MGAGTANSRMVCGYDVYDGTAADLADAIVRALDEGQRQSVFALNPKKVMLAEADPLLSDMIKRCDIRIPDGAGILLASRLEGDPAMHRVTGLDLMLKLCQRCAGTDHSIHLFGGRPGVAQRAAERLVMDYPDLRIAGAYHGYPESWHAAVDSINGSGAQLLFVGLGSPLQEHFIDYALDRLDNVKVCLGVGGSLDVISGDVTRAPLWMRRVRLEWLYRMIRQPRRIRENRHLLGFIGKLVSRGMSRIGSLRDRR